MPLAKALFDGKNPIVAVETISYQKNLKAQIDADMRHYTEKLQTNCFFAVTAVGDKRSKYDRILQSFHGNAYAGLILCHSSHTKFIEQFTLYSTTIQHDDVIDSGSMAVFQLDPEGTSYKALHLGGVRRSMTAPSLGLHAGGGRMFPTVGRTYQHG